MKNTLKNNHIHTYNQILKTKGLSKFNQVPSSLQYLDKLEEVAISQAVQRFHKI